jgi:sucrose-6-phosphate hydrolase SacC (GH32 family)
MKRQEFLQQCSACGGNWTAMIMSGIKEMAPEVYDAMPDREYDFDEVVFISNHLCYDAPHFRFNMSLGGHIIEHSPDGKFIFRGEDGGAYACQIFKNAPDGIVTGIAWQQSRIRHAAFSQSMTLPFQMRLKDGKVLVSPHPAVKTLRSRTWSYAPLTTADSMPAGNGLWELKMTLLRENKTEMQLCGLNFSFDGVANTINVDGKSFPAPECAEFRIFIDRTSIEVYAADGSFWCARDAEPDAAQPPVVLPPGTEIPHLILHALEKT